MSAVCLDLETTLARLDPNAAAMLERIVRDAVALAKIRDRSPATDGPVDARGWPKGYFEQTAGSFAGEPMEVPADPPAEPLPRW